MQFFDLIIKNNNILIRNNKKLLEIKMPKITEIKGRTRNNKFIIKNNTI